MRALKTKIKGLKKTQFERLKYLTANAKNLYNQALWTLRQAYEVTGKYFSYPKMDKAMKQVENLEGEVNYKLLKAKVAQQTLRKLDKNFKGFFRASQDFKINPKKYKGQPKPPRFKQGKYDNLVYDYQAFQIKEKLVVKEAEFEIKSFKIDPGKTFQSVDVIIKEAFVVLEKDLEISVPKQLIGAFIKQVEIIPKYNSFQAVFVYDDEQNYIYQQVNSQKVNTSFPEQQSGMNEVKPDIMHNNVLAIDLGLNNLATCVSNGVVKPFIIDGLRLKSINAYYNKRKAKIQRTLEKTRGKKWSRQLQSITNWRNAAINDYIHRASQFLVKTCLEFNISKVVVGDVTLSLDSINLGKKNNQNFVNLSLGQFIDKLSYKLGSHGIKLEVTNESYTSKASFIDGDFMPKKYNPKVKHKRVFSGRRLYRGLYKANDGTFLNADANGAYNILRKNDPNFSFEKLMERVGTKIHSWLHPTKRIRFFIQKQLNTTQSNPKLPLGEGIVG